MNIIEAMDLAANTQRPLPENISAANFTWVVSTLASLPCALLLKLTFAHRFYL